MLTLAKFYKSQVVWVIASKKIIFIVPYLEHNMCLLIYKWVNIKQLLLQAQFLAYFQFVKKPEPNLYPND